MNIDHGSPVPLHIQAEELLRKLIEEEEYKNGKLLPGEVELSRMMDISRNTLRQAINQLVFEGRLVRKKGVGTRVARKGMTSGVRNWLSFSQEMKRMGIEVRNYELRVRRGEAYGEIASFFETEAGTKCIVMERVRGNTSFPIVYFISYFNPSLPVTGEENYNLPLYEMLEKEYGIVVKVSKEEISARLAGEDIAGKLEISPDDPILVRKRFVYDGEGVPVEYNVGFYRADSFTYTIEASR